MAATVLSLELVTEQERMTANLAASFAIAIAFVKVRFVGIEFMELRHAPLWVRCLFEGWSIIAALGLIVLYWFGPDLF